MNNKEYGVKLNVDIKNFTAKLNEAKDYTKNVMSEIKEKIKEPMEEVGETSKNSFTGRLEELGKLSGKMAQLTIDYANAVALEGKQSQSALQLKDRIRGLNDEISSQSKELEKVGDALSDLFEEEEKTTSGMSKFGTIIDNVKDKGKGLSVSFFRFGDDVSKSIQRGVSSLKRFGLSLLGIHSLYALVSRATNAYMAQDNKLHTRMQANWIALGAMLAPIIEKIISLFQRLVAYVNVFWKAFTGKNLIDIALKKVQKTAKGTTKSVKELNRELANVDEITNLNFDQGGGDIDAGGVGDDAYDLEDALNEIKNMQLNPKIVEIIQNVAQKLKDVWNWCKRVKDKFTEWGISLGDVLKLAGVIFGASQVGRIVSGIAKIIGVAGGTAGIYGMVTTLGLVDVYLGVKLVKKVKELGEVWNQQRTSEARLGESHIQILYTVEKEIKKIDEQLKNNNLTEEERVKLENMKKDKILMAQDAYKQFNKDANDGVKFSKAQTKEMENMKKKLEDLTKTKWRMKVDVDAEPSEKTMSWWDKFTNGIRGAYNGLIDLSGGGTGRGFAKGNVAYQPTQAVFGEYAGARSNPEITAPQNMIRETLFEALSDALPLTRGNQGGDTILYVNGRELARATYSDFQNERNRLGSSNVAVRRS